ncbi:multiple inositol polyphosphate phosphatase 1-like [Pectinophora gossypiella]|uniref:multiple inositol polyphosphate phosphatase 1-like n=1 Tax=Pectinophora gossypiella TaxID=13191 RepID=UPI00214EA389|nr:multiple inositol polyphosphate phosphatase 1-like [Pectinophora gossypiella]
MLFGYMPLASRSVGRGSQYDRHCVRVTPRFPRVLYSNHRQIEYYPESRVKSNMGRSILAVLALVSLVQGQRETCLSVDEDPYLLFGLKTAYLFANKGIPAVRTHDVPGCQPMALWLLNRHGSHNPEADEISDLQKLTDFKNNILDNYRSRNNIRDERICQSDVNLLSRWEWNPRHNATFAGDLTSDGYITTQQLAQAWRQKFPGLLTNNRHDYLFKFVNNERLKTSFRAFTEGLFRAQAEELDIVKQTDEKLLMPYKSCSAWINDVEKNNETYYQQFIFESKREYREMISNISQRLGFSWDIHEDIIRRIYNMCRYNKAWDVTQISPWCAAFTREDLKRLEYAEDLNTYYKYGYGTPINQQIGCTLVKDMMDFLTNHVEREPPQQPRTVIHFTEAPTILMTLAALGTHRDSAPLTGDNYHTNTAQSRKWATSSMLPYNANLAAVLYKCTPNGNFQYNDRYQVLFLENEKTMYLDGCKVGLCDWSYVKSRFGEVADKCNLDVCNGGNRNSYLGVAVILAVVTRYLL